MSARGIVVRAAVAGIPGLDWEIHCHARGWHTRHWHAELIWQTTLMAVVYGRWWPLLAWRMRRAQPAVVAAVRLGPPSANARPGWTEGHR